MKISATTRTTTLAILLALLAAGCAGNRPLQQPPLSTVLEQHASAGPLADVSGELITDNDAALAAKLAMIESARETLDLAYYIFADDYSSSAFAQALLDATGRGVRVRLLLDYFSAYPAFDRLAWLEREGGGKLEIRLYNPPTAEIIRDAAYLTLSCADVGVTGKTCENEKQQAVDRRFTELEAAGRRPTEATVAGSGLFLSGLYGKNPKMMAWAIAHGQDIDPQALATDAGSADPAQTEKLKELGKLYFKARYLGGIDGLTARLKLAFIRLAFAEQVNPVFATVGTYLPLARQNDASAQRDWDYLTEFLHHKLLLADGQSLILGGRNVEDSYHMHPGPLADKYIFMDTDARLRLKEPDPALRQAFDRLWQLPGMVATLAQVRQQAPNDHLANFAVFEAASKTCADDAACTERYVDRHFIAAGQRMDAAGQRHRENLRSYRTEYRPTPAPAPIPLDQDALVHYLENLPIAGGTRSYGARHEREAASGKNIHAAWRAALQEVCAAGKVSREIIFHNAYLFLPANLLAEIGAALDGRRPCPGTRFTLITNSLETTDLSVVNLLAVWQMKALVDHLLEGPLPGRTAASLRYFEYQPVADSRLSLHSKVMLFGDRLFVGSANADVRSLMMDSNNGIFIGNAPGFATAYGAWLQDMLTRPGRIAERTDKLGAAQEALSTAMDAHLDKLLQRYASERLDAEQEKELRAQMHATARQVYDLSRAILRGDADAAERFNALFKAI